jgi:hypothetical protein
MILKNFTKPPIFALFKNLIGNTLLWGWESVVEWGQESKVARVEGFADLGA